jgi:hypothetical protein
MKYTITQNALHFSNQATKQPSNQATKQPSNQATKQRSFLLTCLLFLLLMKSSSQTGVINFYTPEISGHHYSFINSNPYLLNAEIGEIYSADSYYHDGLYLKVIFEGDNFSDYLNFSISVASPEISWALLPNIITSPYNIVKLNCPVGTTGYPFGAKIDKYPKIRITVTKKSSAPDELFTCKLIRLKMRLYNGNNECQPISPEKSLDIWVSNYSPIYNKSDFENNDKQNLSDDIWNTPDLMMKDNDFDDGREPFLPSRWNNDFRNISGQELGIATKPSLWNRYNFDMGYSHLEPMHSVATPQNPNYLYAHYLNRSCLTTPNDAELNMYWTIARLWEPWSQDWKNFNKPGSINNYVYFPKNSLDPNDKIPTGNEITINNINDYSSNSQSIILSSLGPGSAGLAVAKQWLVPNPVWFENQTKFSFFFNANKTAPAICLLAKIVEPWKVDDGLFFRPLPNSYDANIVDFVSKNNNVVTRNTFALNSVGGYLTRSKFSNNPVTRSGIMLIDNPLDKPVFGIAVKNGCKDVETCENLLDNGQINIHLDMLLWQRWLAAGAHGQNIQIVDQQIISITNNFYATLDSIHIYPGEKTFLAVEAEFFESNEPNANYVYNFDISPYTIDQNSIVGVPTIFKAIVLANPQIEQKHTGIEQITKSDFKVFPNPTNGNFYINVDGGNIEKASIYDLQGKLINTSCFDSISSRRQVNIDLKLNGIYFIEVIIDGKISRTKMVFNN